MFCKNCGKEIKDNEQFCAECGTKKSNVEKKETPKKSNIGLITGLIIGGSILVIIVIGFILNNLLENTTWKASDNSQAIFTSDRIDWYKTPGDKNNYYSGTYKFYIGEDAIKHITTELSNYGVTQEEIEGVISRNVQYSKSNFVVVDITYDKYVLNGKEMTIAKPQVPWFGFIVDDNKILDVANMNTGTYITFTKEK